MPIAFAHHARPNTTQITRINSWLLSFRKVKKTYAGNVPVIHGIDMDVKDGEFIVIVGPSGCGKSTLMRMVAGLESVTSGEILIDDQVVNHLEPAERDIAMVFQNYALYPHMTVFENMAYGLKIRKFSKEEIKKRVDAAAQILELGHLLDRRPRCPAASASAWGPRHRARTWSSCSTSRCRTWMPLRVAMRLKS